MYELFFAVALLDTGEVVTSEHIVLARHGLAQAMYLLDQEFVGNIEVLELTLTGSDGVQTEFSNDDNWHVVKEDYVEEPHWHPLGFPA